MASFRRVGVGRDHIAAPWPLSRTGRVGLAAALLALGSGAGSTLAAEPCSAPEPVCASRAAVFQISAFDPFGSAVRIGPDLLVTNRHVVADETRITIRLADGKTVTGEAVPTSFAGDLVLIRAALPDGPVVALAKEMTGRLYTIGLDVGAKAIAAFAEGRILLKPAPDKPHARLYHTAHSQPGVSGGALVNDKGELVAIATSGGEGRNEAVPAGQIAGLKESSGAEHTEKSLAIGKAYRDCTVLVEKAQRSRDVVPANIADEIDHACGASGNRQLYDMAAQVFGISRMFDRSIGYFQRSLEQDPNAINARLGIVVILAFAQRYEQAVEHVRWLLDVIPENREVQRYAVRVGKAAGDEAMMARALTLIETHDPAGLEAAKGFIAAPGRGPKRN